MPAAEGWLYLPLILDLFSRKFAACVMSDSMALQQTFGALDMALGWGDPAPGLTHHSDCGPRFASRDYRQVLASRGITVSMSREGDCPDDAPMSRAFGTVKASGSKEHRSKRALRQRGIAE